MIDGRAVEYVGLNALGYSLNSKNTNKQLQKQLISFIPLTPNIKAIARYEMKAIWFKQCGDWR